MTEKKNVRIVFVLSFLEETWGLFHDLLVLYHLSYFPGSLRNILVRGLETQKGCSGLRVNINLPPIDRFL